MNTQSQGSDASAETDLVTGEHVALRRWDRETPRDWKPETTRPYETVGYVIEGRAVVRVAGTEREVGQGDSYVVPNGAAHSYKIVETFTAIEAIAPVPKA
jgi:quercetin dioxygenase-like cupin family protein